MKKLILAISVLTSGLLSAQTYPLDESFDGISTSGTPATGPLPSGWTTGTGSAFQVYGVENLAPHGQSPNNACSVEMSATHTMDTLITPPISPITANTKLSISYRFVNKAAYPSTGYQLVAGDKVTIDAYLGTSWTNNIATIDMSVNPAPLTAYTTYTYNCTGCATLVTLGLTTIKIRMDVARAGGDWYLDIDDFKVADNIVGIENHDLNPIGLILAPNPSHENFVVSLKNYHSTNSVELKLYNHMGQLAKVSKPDNIVNNQFNVNTTDLAKGMYVVEVISGNEVSKTKVIVE